MQDIVTLQKKLEYARFMHIFLLYAFALIIFLFSTLPHKWWVLLTILVVSSAIEPGLVLKKSMQRINGTFIALMLLIPMLYLMQLNYRLVSVFFVLMALGSTIVSLNTERYDVVVFFITTTIFLLLAQTTVTITPEGPFEMVMNRGVCTGIGVMLTIIADYFLFNGFDYSKKVHLLHQKQLIVFFESKIKEMTTPGAQHINAHIFLEKLREQVNQIFIPISTSAQSLSLDLKTHNEHKQQIALFQETAWQLRRVLFSIAFAQLILKSSKATQTHLKHYQTLIQQARRQTFKEHTKLGSVAKKDGGVKTGDL